MGGCFPWKSVFARFVDYRVVTTTLFVISSVGVSSAANSNCEIKSSCGADCQYANRTTVDPGSYITFDCTVSSEAAENITWEQAKKLAGKGDGTSDLALQESSQNISCKCTKIFFTRKLKIDEHTESPYIIQQGERPYLKCIFSGWPLPPVANWFREEKLITNESKAVYQLDRILGKEGNKTLHSSLNFQVAREDQAGFYKCNATNSIPGWSSSKSKMIQTIYQCPHAQDPIVEHLEVLARKSFNTTLICLVYESEEGCPDDLRWYANGRPLRNSGKYEILEKKTQSKCKREFRLTIFNVTKNDEGNYSCHWICEYFEDKIATIKLKVSVESITDPPTVVNVSTGPLYPLSGQRKKWLLPIIILAAVGGVAVFMAAVRFGVKKKWTSSYELEKCGFNDEVLKNQLFVSYSSKDVSWVNEYLISLLEKHSIAYSIHSRDFELGKPIVQNMADNVYGSRQVVIVLSQNYLASNFCREELHMAFQRGMDTGDSSVILVMINNLRKKQLPAALRDKRLLEFEKHNKKQEWEEKILSEILDWKTDNV